ncbi:hypothetical protein [Dactylosporangium sp. NPDC051541]|uniref:hypothetical protein n=1 Tax=Dactylosporangium sp. NPDC051541 TaxID=3363977 RepID=UPI003793FFBB
MRGQMSFFSKSEQATMRDRTRSRKYSPMVEEFRRVHQEQRDWGLEQRHAAKLRRIYGDNVPVTKEEWLQARAARLAQVVEPSEQIVEPLVVEPQVVEPQVVEPQVVESPEQVVEPQVVASREEAIESRVVESWEEVGELERTCPVSYGPSRSGRPAGRRVLRSWGARFTMCRLEGHRVVGSADGNYRVAWSGP